MAQRPVGHVELGPGLGAELERRLMGEIERAHILVLGSGAGHDAVGLAQRGARVTAVDPDPRQVAHGRDMAVSAAVTVGFHCCELADLAFIRADQVDLAIAVQSLSYLAELDRVFRQAHRVLAPGSHLVVSLPHPAALCADPVDPNRITRRWDSSEPVGEQWIHRPEDLVTRLHRTNFQVDTLLELHEPGPGLLPATLVVRAEKLGT